MTRFIALLFILGSLLGCSEKSASTAKTEPSPSAPPASAAAAPATPATHSASGRIEAVDPVAGTLRIHHGPVASLSWPAMTMDFVVSDKALLNNVKSGQDIDFAFYDRSGDYVVTSIKGKQ